MFDDLEPPFEPEDCGPEDLGAWPGPDEVDGYGEVGALPDPVVRQVAIEALEEFEESLERDRLDGLDAEATLAEAAGTKRSERMVQVRQLWLAAHWADLHAVLTQPSATGKGRERLIQFGGAGTPEVAEFAPAELGAVQAMTDNAAKSLIADALDLRHRFPLLWQRVNTGGVDVWVARRTVQEARGLSREAAVAVDVRIAEVAGSVSWRRLKDIVAAAVLAADPAKAAADAEQAAAGVGVFLDPEAKDGYLGLFIKAAAGEVLALERSIETLSRALKTLGDSRAPQQRRASAAGILADPQAALDLLAQAEAVRKAQRDAAAAARAGDTAAAERIAATLPDGVAPDGRCGRRQPFTCGTAVLYYHLTRETLDAMLAGEPYAAAGVVRVEDIGPVILDQVKQWLGHANVVLKPVINLAGIQPVDHYETPPAIAEAIGLIRSADSWVYGTCTTRHQDNEHTIPYVPMNRGGPPGQTDPRKMSTMTRGHHRIKTFGGWTVKQLRPGAWLYRSPHRYYFLVDQHGTTALEKLE